MKIKIYYSGSLSSRGGREITRRLVIYEVREWPGCRSFDKHAARIQNGGKEGREKVGVGGRNQKLEFDATKLHPLNGLRDSAQLSSAARVARPKKRASDKWMGDEQFRGKQEGGYLGGQILRINADYSPPRLQIFLYPFFFLCKIRSLKFEIQNFPRNFPFCAWRYFSISHPSFFLCSRIYG